MPYYHVYIKWIDEIRNFLIESNEKDFNISQLDELVNSIKKGRPVLFRNHRIKPSQIREFSIWETSERAHGKPQGWIGEHGNEVTSGFVIASPSRPYSNKTEVSRKTMQSKDIARSKNVFIVHGRDHKPMKELQAMLTEFGLNPIVLHEQPSGSRTIVEKLEKHSGVEYAFVIVTPDDIGLSAILPILPPFPPRLPFEKRVRQNVILEFGYFMGLLGRDRVCCLYKGSVELPSDMHGIVYIPFDSIEEVRFKIMKELKAAGYEIKL